MTTDTTEKKPRAKRTVRNSEVVTKSALALPLQERVDLVTKLNESIKSEVETIKAAAAHAENIANGSY